MQEVFEKIVEILENKANEAEKDMQLSDSYADAQAFGGKQEGYENAIEIVKQAFTECSNGHFGCNTNGEHERCYGCGLTDCKSRNKIWFGAVGDGTDTNVGNNGWIPCSERLPEERQDVLVCFDNIDGLIIAWYCPNGGKWRNSSTDTVCKAEPIAWMSLPEPYHPNGE